jgi:hypothetical protein
VPIGVERVDFNAHRVFAPGTILNAMRELRLVSFAAVDDGDRFWPTAAPAALVDAQFSCGMFEFTK